MIILSTLTQIQLPDGTLPALSGVPPELQGGLQDTGKNLLQLGLSWLFIIAAVLALIFTIFSGIQWITSGGDPGKVTAAKNRLMYSIIGLIIVAVAFLTLRVIISTLGVSNQPYLPN